MRRSLAKWTGIALVSGALVAGCAGDISKQLVSNPELQTKVMDTIGDNADLAGQMVDRLLGGDTRQLVLDRVFASGEATQGLMMRMAQDRTMVDGLLNLAVQDSAMRTHVMTMFRGMEMMRGARK